MPGLAVILASAMPLTFSSARTAQPRTPSPASVDPAEVEFFLEDDLGVDASWTYTTDVDDFTDEVTHSATVFASDGDGLLRVSCYQDDDDIVVSVTTSLFLDTAEDQMDEKPIRYRVDKRSAVSDRWLGSGQTSVAVEPKSLHFVLELVQGTREVLVELTSWNRDRKRVRFPLGNAGPALDRVLGACR